MAVLFRNIRHHYVCRRACGTATPTSSAVLPCCSRFFIAARNVSRIPSLRCASMRSTNSSSTLSASRAFSDVIVKFLSMRLDNFNAFSSPTNRRSVDYFIFFIIQTRAFLPCPLFRGQVLIRRNRTPPGRGSLIFLLSAQCF